MTAIEAPGDGNHHLTTTWTDYFHKFVNTTDKGNDGVSD